MGPLKANTDELGLLLLLITSLVFVDALRYTEKKGKLCYNLKSIEYEEVRSLKMNATTSLY